MIRLSSADYVNLGRNRGVADLRYDIGEEREGKRESKRNLISRLAADPREISLLGSLEIFAYWPRLHVSFRFPFPVRRDLIVIQVFASSGNSGASPKWLPNFSPLWKSNRLEFSPFIPWDYSFQGISLDWRDYFLLIFLEKRSTRRRFVELSLLFFTFQCFL